MLTTVPFLTFIMVRSAELSVALTVKLCFTGAAIVGLEAGVVGVGWVTAAGAAGLTATGAVELAEADGWATTIVPPSLGFK